MPTSTNTPTTNDLPIVFGAMCLGTIVDEQTSFAILDRFVEAGGRMIDTANCYSFWLDPSGFGGQSEQLLGRWLAQRPGMRDEIYLSTKAGAEPGDSRGHAGWPGNYEGLSAAVVRREIEGSLKRLGTDHVEMFWTHMEDRSVSLEETVGVLGELVAEGKAGRLGCSNHPVWRVERARHLARTAGVAEYTALQLHYSYLRLRPGALQNPVHRFGSASEETLDYVQCNPELDLWGYTTLLSGGYSGRDDKPIGEGYEHPGSTRRLQVLAEVADELGVTRNQVVLAWLVGGEPAVVPIVGASSVAQLDEALAGVVLELPAELRARLDEPV